MSAIDLDRRLLEEALQLLRGETTSALSLIQVIGG